MIAFGSFRTSDTVNFVVNLPVGATRTHLYIRFLVWLFGLTQQQYINLQFVLSVPFRVYLTIQNAHISYRDPFTHKKNTHVVPYTRDRSLSIEVHTHEYCMNE